VEELFPTLSMPKSYTRGTSLELSQLRVSSVRESVKRGLESGGRGIAIVEVVTRKRLVTD
jgi:hypothetical protein